MYHVAFGTSSINFMFPECDHECNAGNRHSWSPCKDDELIGLKADGGFKAASRHITNVESIFTATSRALTRSFLMTVHVYQEFLSRRQTMRALTFVLVFIYASTL